MAGGELSQDIDRELALDLLAAPLFWRVIVTQGVMSGRWPQPYVGRFMGAVPRREAVAIVAPPSR